MKALTFLFLLFFASVSFAKDALTKLTDELYDMRIEVNKTYRDEFVADAKLLENKEAREFLVKSEKENGQTWIDYLKHMRESKDLKAKLLVLRLEIVGDLQTAYYDLEYATGFIEKAQARGSIKRWSKALKKLEQAEALAKKPQTPAKK